MKLLELLKAQTIWCEGRQRLDVKHNVTQVPYRCRERRYCLERCFDWEMSTSQAAATERIDEINWGEGGEGGRHKLNT